MTSLLFPSLLVAVGLFGTCMSQLSPLWLSGGGSGSPGPAVGTARVSGYCSPQERRTAFDRCIMNFGVQHMDHFSFLARNAPVCRAEVFRCREVDSLIRCLNSQPTTVISNQCWVNMKGVLTMALNDYNIPCSYNDLEKRCRNQFNELKPVAQRSSLGQGARNDAFSAIYRRIAPMITMMIYSSMNGGGMFGGLAGAFGA